MQFNTLRQTFEARCEVLHPCIIEKQLSMVIKIIEVLTPASVIVLPLFIGNSWQLHEAQKSHGSHVSSMADTLAAWQQPEGIMGLERTRVLPSYRRETSSCIVVAAAVSRMRYGKLLRVDPIQ